MQIKPTYLIIAILSIALFFSVKSCTDNKLHAEDLQAKIDYKDNSIKQFENKLGKIISEQEVAKTTNEKTIKELSEQVFQLKKQDEKRIKEVQALVRLIQNVKINTIEIPYTDTVQVYPPGTLVSVDSVVIPPKNFEVLNDAYAISGTVLLKGVKINSISLPDTASFRIVQQRPKGILNRIFQPNKTVIQSVHTNPYFTTNGIQSIVLKEKPNIFNKYIKPILFFGAGMYIKSKL